MPSVVMAEFGPIKGVRVIGLGHKARHGKDTAARYLIEQYGAMKFSFGNGLYSVARCCFNMTEKNPGLLQALGTEVGRAHDDYRWIRNLYWQIKDEQPKLAVIPDVRFPNEADFVRAIGGMLIKVSRLNPDGSPFVAPDRSATHPSEVALDGYPGWDDRIVVPDGGFGHLIDELDRIIDRSMGI